MATDTSTAVNGIVTNVNERGLQLSGTEGWYNVSRFIKEPLTMPAVGDNVALKLDPQGFVRAIVQNGPTQIKEQVITPRSLRGENTPNGREQIRLECLRAALIGLGGRDARDSNPDTVIGYAAAFEHYVLTGEA